MSELKRFPPRRRRSGTTDYRKRYRMVRSGRPRLVVRRTGTHFIVQLVEPKAGGDRTILTVNSGVLRRYGWKAGLKNTPAAYLTGYLAGALARSKGYSEAIADIGMRTPSKGARVFAVMKGAIDAGLSIPTSEDVLPDESRIRGEVLSEYVSSLGEQGVERFSASDLEVLRDLPSHFEEVLRRIKAELPTGR
ncbi:MAG: 50S ribosomal protein L18 [Thaumarchaeota archaeon]|nr:50S ribosomal protein L18 [Candidatus Calditenuaceae archaeon]MDW8042347.1 50S ribosomal protein L18 [Nitrososphaerota archaeon]